PVISHDIIKTGHAFSCSLSLILNLHLVSHCVNELIKAVNPSYYEVLVKLWAMAEKNHKFPQVIGSDDPLLMEGHKIMYNHQTRTPDNRAALVVLRPFAGGTLHIPSLKLCIWYTNDDMILIWGKILLHEVEAFQDGHRICMGHFTHDKLWQECGIRLL
ncbi:hypothetical protein B0H10DRAFT_1797608, partial [Mycena sp. CBHHK59/15]